MSHPILGPDDPLSRAELASTISAIRPDWQLVDADPIPDGSDIVYTVTVAPTERDGTDPEATREAVLKCFRTADALSFRTHERFLVEVDLLELVGRETDIPVPAVFGVSESHDDHPMPAFLMEQRPGESVSNVPVDGTDGVFDRLVRESGRYLAQIHDLRSFDAFGDLVTADNGQTDATRGEPVVADGRSECIDRVRDIVEDSLDELDETRFADLEAGLREFTEDRLATLDLDAEPVLLHGDYRPGNLLGNPETGEMTGVLDWGAAQAGDPRYELAWVVREFSEQAPVDSPVRRRVRETLFDAYESARDDRLDRDAVFERRQRFYLVVTWIAELGSFDRWWAGADESVRERRAEQLRENVDALV